MNKLLIIAGLCTILCNTSCESKKEEQEQETKFLVTSPLVKDTNIVKDYVCQIHSISHIEIRSQERGYLQKFYVDEGQHVKKGDLLFEIMPTLYQAEQQKAAAEARLAEIEYKNTKALSDSNIVSSNELAMSKAKYDKANAELELAKVHLNFTQIRAPFDGIIDRFQVRLGSLIDEGELITSLSDNSQLWVYFNIPEAQYLDYMTEPKTDEKEKVGLQMANGQIFKYPGIVETIEADFNNETGNIPFRATFPNPDGLLRHGQTGSILMTIPLKNALLIPQKATFEVMDKKFVFVIDEKNEVHTREVTILADIEDIYAISNGLKETDKILLEGLRKVKDNDEITYDFQDPKEVISHLKVYAE